MTPLAAHRVERLWLSLEELADRSGASKATLSNVERGYFHKFRARRARFARIYRLPIEKYERLVKAAQKGGVA